MLVFCGSEYLISLTCYLQHPPSLHHTHPTSFPTLLLSPSLLPPPSEQAQNSEEDEDRLSKVTHTYRSQRKAEPAGLSDMGATLTLETETEQDRDQRAVMEKALKLNQVWVIGTPHIIKCTSSSVSSADYIFNKPRALLGWVTDDLSIVLYITYPKHLKYVQYPSHAIYVH